MNDIHALYELWKKNADADPDLIAELESVAGNEDEILDRFYKNLEFGTGGLRGVIGAGTNRMNVYTVGQATQGLAAYLNSTYTAPAVAIAYDSRIKSKKFAEFAACVLAANDIKVYLYPELVPTPMLSFAVRYFSCKGGIVLTASHNPAKYNGYKCYDPNGYQMTDEAAAETYRYIQQTDLFTGIKTVDFDAALADGKIEYIGAEVVEAFYKEVEKTCLSKDICAKSGLKVIYTPLNGTGNKHVREMLRRVGISEVRVVKEQELPDGNFPTCPYPNPEIRQVFECGLAMTETFPADLLLATDPDCDRVGIAVKCDDGYKLMTGNEVGVLLTEYLLTRRAELGLLPKNPVVIKSFVTTDLVTAVAKTFGAEVVNLLTGFKYIGEYMTMLEAKGEAGRFVVGMEESYGYLAGMHVRDKDAVVASTLICEMAAYYKAKGMSLYELMQSLYQKYGMYQNSLLNYAFEGAAGMQKMTELMDALRANAPKTIGGLDVLTVADYKTSTETEVATGKQTAITLPKSNVLCYGLPGGNKVIVRPSGTEPKLKVYLTAVAEDLSASQAVTDRLAADFNEKVK